MRKQGKVEAAKAIDADFHKAWAQSDVKLTASRF